MFKNVKELIDHLYNKYNISNTEKYESTFIGLIITFNLSKRDEMNELLNFIDNNINMFGLHNVKKIYGNIDVSTNENYISDLKTNYNKFSISDNFDEIEKITKYQSQFVNSVDDMIKYIELVYRCVKVNDYSIAQYFFKNKISENVYNKLSKFREKQLNIDMSNIPYVNGVFDNFEYETVRIWDSYLMCFDIDNTINGSNLSLKEKIMTNKNYRLITIKKDNKIINHIVVKKINDNYEYTILKQDGNNYNNLIDEIDNKIKHSNICRDPLKIYNSKDLLDDELEYYRMEAVYNKAFDTSKILTISFKDAVLFGKDIYIGRDYIIITKDTDTLNIYVIARHNENYKSKIGSIELYDDIVNIINSTDKLIKIDCYRTSYYLICKLASEGIIYIKNDKLYDRGNIVNEYRLDKNIDEQFYLGKINKDNNYSTTYNNDLYNEIEFYSTNNLTNNLDLQLELKKQKLIYSQIVKILEFERNNAKYKDLNISNLDIKTNYSDIYLKYIIEKTSLGYYSIINLNDDIERKKIK